MILYCIIFLVIPSQLLSNNVSTYDRNETKMENNLCFYCFCSNKTLCCKSELERTLTKNCTTFECCFCENKCNGIDQKSKLTNGNLRQNKINAFFTVMIICIMILIFMGYINWKTSCCTSNPQSKKYTGVNQIHTDDNSICSSCMFPLHSVSSNHWPNLPTSVSVSLPQYEDTPPSYDEDSPPSYNDVVLIKSQTHT